MSDIAERLRASDGGDASLREEAADRIEALEAALREIITLGDEYDHPYAEEIARAALAPEQNKSS